MPRIEITNTNKIKILQNGYAFVGSREKGSDKVVVNSSGGNAADDMRLDVDETEELGKWLLSVVKEMRGT